MPKEHRPASISLEESQACTRLILDNDSQHPKCLVSYHVEESKEVRTVVWRDIYGDVIKHMKVPRGTRGIPYTYPSAVGAEHKNVVVFRHYSEETRASPGALTKHDFQFENHDRQTNGQHTAEYRFLVETESCDFQSRIRGRALLKTYDTVAISDVHFHPFPVPNTSKGFARETPIKLWRRNDTAFTFLATFGTMKQQTHLEFYVTWFRHEAEIHDRKLVLKFNRQSDIDPQPKPSEKQHKRKHSSPCKEPNGKASKSEKEKRRGSGQELPRLHNGLRKMPDPIEFVKKNDWDSLEIQFTHDGDAEDFLKECIKFQALEKLPPTTGLYFVSPFSNSIGRRRELPSRLRHPLNLFTQFTQYANRKTSLPEPSSPVSPGTTQSPVDLSASQDLEDGSRKLKLRVQAAIKKWWDDFNDNRDEIFPYVSDSYAAVKIAIIDTGLDAGNPYVDSNWKPRRIYRDFIEDDTIASKLKFTSSYSDHYVERIVGSLEQGRQDEPVDLAGHGTHLAGIVLQLTPHATLCVARVLEDKVEYDTGKAARRVALAILYAVKVWRAKIINLSIGFDRDKLDSLVQSGDNSEQILIHSLKYARQEDVVVFAAASNHANRKRHAFPACKPDYVLGINSTNGSSGRSWFNPLIQKYDHNLSILGEHIKSTWLQHDGQETTKQVDGSVWKRQEGTSQATTIAACAAVLILQFGRQYGVGKNSKKLETFEGIRGILREMAKQATDQSFRDIVPWTTVFRTSGNHDEDVDRIRTRMEEILDEV